MDNEPRKGNHKKCQLSKDGSQPLDIHINRHVRIVHQENWTTLFTSTPTATDHEEELSCCDLSPVQDDTGSWRTAIGPQSTSTSFASAQSEAQAETPTVNTITIDRVIKHDIYQSVSPIRSFQNNGSESPQISQGSLGALPEITESNNESVTIASFIQEKNTHSVDIEYTRKKHERHFGSLSEHLDSNDKSHKTGNTKSIEIVQTHSLKSNEHSKILIHPPKSYESIELKLRKDKNEKLHSPAIDVNETDESFNDANKGCTIQPKSKKKSKTRLSFNFLRYLQFSMLVILALDVILISLQVTEKGNKPALQYSGIVIAILFMIDLALRLYAFGWKMLKSFLEVLDTIIVIASFIIAILFYVYGVRSTMQYFKFLIIVRPVRYARLLKLCKYRKTFQEFSRKIVSQNRRRWEDEEYNLDLTYITDQILVMSFPSEGCRTIFRNSCKEVANFLNEKHTGLHYTVYNLCSERTYDISYFEGPVIWCAIDDHNVPGLRNMLQYARLIQGFLNKNKNNVAVIHCKGGKGRTGTIVSALLIQSGLYNAEQSLQHFASKRTSKHLQCCFPKEQRVSVHSQIRYIYYFEKIMRQYNGELPPRKELSIHSIIITYISAITDLKGDDLILKIQQMYPDKLWEYKLLSRSNCSLEFNEEKDTLKIILKDLPTVWNDIKIMFFRSSIFPCYKNSFIIYFWFHSAFIDGSQVSFSKDQLDTRSKRPFYKQSKDFQIQLNFLEQV